MNIAVEPGRYVVAVSGGVDSVTLLHLLQEQPDLKLTVAHFDHGIRGDSAEDRRLVQKLAKDLKLPFVFGQAQLGVGASEATARKARYDFLRQIQRATRARGIITAHHQDDALETAILNMLRGTGRKGLTSLSSSPDVHRPLLNIPKIDIVNHATERGLIWREDSTNQDVAYRRNYVRQRIMPRLDLGLRVKLWDLLVRQQQINQELDMLLSNQLHMQLVAGTLDRESFIQLPHAVSKELLASWLRAQDIRDFDKKTLERLSAQAKTGQPGKTFDIVRGHKLRLTDSNLALERAER